MLFILFCRSEFSSGIFLPTKELLLIFLVSQLLLVSKSLYLPSLINFFSDYRILER